MKTLSKAQIFTIIDERIKNEIQLKNAYIEKNGYNNVDTIKRFDSSIATLSSLYSTFEKEFYVEP